MRTRLIVGLVAACALATSAAPALGEDDATVTAQVSVAAPCIQVTPASLDFGTLGLSSDNANPVSAARPLVASNCGAQAWILGRGTNASSTGGTTWTLDSDGEMDCPATNRYVQRIDTGPVSIPLSSTQDIRLRTLAGAETANLNAIVTMPCVGSGGAGEVMTFSYVFTAVLA